MSGDPDGRLPIVQYWHSTDVPDYIERLVASFREKNPGLRHLLFHRESARELIATQLGERELSAFDACAVPAMQADYFRYCAMYALGGICADADYACRCALAPLLNGRAVGNLFEGEGPVLNGLFAFRVSRHPLVRMAIDIATENIEHRRGGRASMATGPLVFTALRNLWRAGSIERLREGVRPEGRWHALGRTMEAAMSRHGPIELAFDGVVISPLPALFEWVEPQDPKNLPYKSGSRHWANWRGSMFSG